MKIAIPAEGPDLNARVGDRLGLSSHVLIIDLDSKDVAVHLSPRDSGRGSGMQLVALIIETKSDVVLTGWCSPTAEKYLSAHGIRVVTGISGTTEEVLDRIKNKDEIFRLAGFENSTPKTWKLARRDVETAIRTAFNQIRNLLPVMTGVVFLTGLFSTFVSSDILTSFFSGSMWWDSLKSTFAGSLLAGNPINSYIIGRQLFELGISPVAVTAFICSWVTVGLIQMPAESAALGWKFAVVRNAGCFGLSIAISFLMIWILNFLGA